MDIKKVVLAYSGGLDTSVILKWLKEKYNCEVTISDYWAKEDEVFETFNLAPKKINQLPKQDAVILAVCFAPISITSANS